jgi:hypothetical protein
MVFVGGPGEFVHNAQTRRVFKVPDDVRVALPKASASRQLQLT